MEQATTTLLENGQVRVRVGEAEGTFVVHGKRLVPLSQEQVYRDLEQLQSWVERRQDSCLAKCVVEHFHTDGTP